MARTVLCRKLKKNYQAWICHLFQALRVRRYSILCLNRHGSNGWNIKPLINEMRLNMMDLTARHYLAEQREKFFDGEDVDQAEGYVPPSQ